MVLRGEAGGGAGAGAGAVDEDRHQDAVNGHALTVKGKNEARGCSASAFGRVVEDEIDTRGAGVCNSSVSGCAEAKENKSSRLST